MTETLDCYDKPVWTLGRLTGALAGLPGQLLKVAPSLSGKVLSGMLEMYRNSNALVLAVPAGGVAVGAAIAKQLLLPLDVAVVSKITPSWNTEVGYGAVAFDGAVMLNEDLLGRLHLSREEIGRIKGL